MDDPVDFAKFAKKRQKSRTERDILVETERQVAILTREMDLAILKDPGYFFKNFDYYLRRAQNIEYVFRNQDGWAKPVLTKLNEIYLSLNPDMRRKATRSTLQILGLFTEDVAKKYVEEIEEPWYARDVLANADRFFPDTRARVRVMQHCKNWNEFELNHYGEPRDIWMAYVVMHHAITALGVRVTFYNKNQELVDRTLDAIAAFVNQESQYSGLITLTQYDPLHHHKIRQKIQEKQWVELEPDN